MPTDSTTLLSTTDAPDYGSVPEANRGATAIRDVDVPAPTYPGRLKLVPISIAMGLAIFVLGLVSIAMMCK